MTSPSIARRALAGALIALALGAAPAAADHYRSPTTATYLLPDKRLEIEQRRSATVDRPGATMDLVATVTKPGTRGQVCVQITDEALKLTENGCAEIDVFIPDWPTTAGTHGVIPSTYTIGGRKPRTGTGTIRLDHWAGADGRPFEWQYAGCVPYGPYDLPFCAYTDPTNRLMWGRGVADGVVSTSTGARFDNGLAYVEVSTPAP